MLGLEYTGDQTLMHSAIYYRVLGIIVPVVLVAIGRASGGRWRITMLAAMYTVLWLAGELDLPFIPGTGKAGSRVLRPSRIWSRSAFPALVLPGAIVLDFILGRFASRSDTGKALIAGAGFVARDSSRELAIRVFHDVSLRAQLDFSP